MTLRNPAVLHPGLKLQVHPHDSRHTQNARILADVSHLPPLCRPSIGASLSRTQVWLSGPPSESDDSDSPTQVIDTTDGELEVANLVIAPGSFCRRLVRLIGNVSMFLTCISSATLAGDTFPCPIIKA